MQFLRLETIFNQSVMVDGRMDIQSLLTPLTKLGELGQKLSIIASLKSKKGVQVNDIIKTCYSHEGSAKKFQILSTNSCIASSNDIMQILGL